MKQIPSSFEFGSHSRVRVCKISVLKSITAFGFAAEQTIQPGQSVAITVEVAVFRILQTSLKRASTTSSNSRKSLHYSSDGSHVVRRLPPVASTGKLRCDGRTDRMSHSQFDGGSLRFAKRRRLSVYFDQRQAVGSCVCVNRIKPHTRFTVISKVV